MSTKIEWTTETWNPITGCTPISEGCANCYAKRMANRLRGRCGYPEDDPFRVTVHEDRWETPFRWRKPRRVFVSSMGDLFHGDVPNDVLHRVFAVICQAKEHVFQVLTKRPERMRAYMKEWGRYPTPEMMPWPVPNLWLGVTAENQARADERIPVLLDTPAAVRFVSVEPMLEGINLTQASGGPKNGSVLVWFGGAPDGPRIHWVICGGETGPGARTMDPAWARSLRDQCGAAGVPFFFKEWAGGREMEPGEMPREYPK